MGLCVENEGNNVKKYGTINILKVQKYPGIVVFGLELPRKWHWLSHNHMKSWQGSQKGGGPVVSQMLHKLGKGSTTKKALLVVFYN